MTLEGYLRENNLTQAEFGALVGVTQGMVSQWVKGIRPVSPEKATEIERVTGGSLKRSDLCPDFPWDAAVA